MYLCGFWGTHGNELHPYGCAHVSGGRQHRDVLWECTVIRTREERYFSRDVERWEIQKLGLLQHLRR